jgi:type IV pilus assembly protein PilE
MSRTVTCKVKLLDDIADHPQVIRQVKRRMAGLTLVELMVTLAVLVILASLVYPAYTTFVLKSRRAEARVALSDLAMAEQRFFTINGRFGTSAQLGTAYTDVIDEMTDGDGDGTPDYYSIAVASTTTSFSVTATASGAQGDDGTCSAFVIDELGVRTATGTDPDKCW